MAVATLTMLTVATGAALGSTNGAQAHAVAVPQAAPRALGCHRCGGRLDEVGHLLRVGDHGHVPAGDLDGGRAAHQQAVSQNPMASRSRSKA